MAIDVSLVAAAIASQAEPVGLIGAACLLIWGALVAFKFVREAFGIGSSGGGGGGGLAAAHERAEGMEAMGHGQSAAYREMAGVSAYDAGYSGREFDASWGEEARSTYHQAQADRNSDLQNAGPRDQFDDDWSAYERQQAGGK